MYRHSRRFISGTRLPEDIKSFTLSRGSIGRKVFNKGWSHLEPRYPINIQERFHRAPVERVFHPNIVENVGLKESGPKDSLEWRMAFETMALDASKINLTNISEYKQLSPWHDIPLGFICSNTNNLLFNYINEIPHGDRAKMECATDEDWNPIKQDVKKGALRYFKYGDLPFNYGFIPQTWEDPDHCSAFIDKDDLFGDNDPVDVVEISDPSEFVMERGLITPIKVLGVLGLIDEGETDWKIIGLRANHPEIHNINTIQDANNILGRNVDEIVIDWFENYKVPDGKPVNEFSHNKEIRSSDIAVEIIEECHRQWYNLMLGGVKNEKLNLTSVTQKYLIAQGLTTKNKLDALPNIEYPRLVNWQPKPMQKIQTVDHMQEEYEPTERSPDQERKRTNAK
eukprot:CAMPEP_0201582758 /NCGR_PEP_ID=MMETSP0190_2-20130828/90376_1 /ASSEMBLY_ACC=CAM_ASM_000263 /TAXON_ID=37353 /ORGANISM="Rosalina sp." /LENGTH=396 /DNA_ID=CAMNT_0048023377 /DNA_START=67 /DNA_END=1257 /DNA_ORIENTATION=-